AYDRLGRHDEAIALCEATTSYAARVGDRELEGTSLYKLGMFARGQKRYEAATERLQRSLEIFRELNAPSRAANSLNELMLTAADSGNPRLAIFYGKQAINDFQTVRGAISDLDKELREGFLKSHEDAYWRLASLLIAGG